MENDKHEPIDAEVSRTKAFGIGFGDYTKEKQETNNAVKAAESIVRNNQPRKNIFSRFMQRIQGK